MINKAAIILTVAVGIICCCSTPASALNSANQQCATIESVFARGSGNTGSTDPDDVTSTFKEQLTNSTKSTGISLQFYALGTEAYNAYQYPHAGIFGSWSDATNGFGATITNGEGFVYGESVDKGVGELTAYLQQRMSKCPEAHYIIGGYSQGAQVTSDTLARLTKNERDKITYVALFGNPKLYLPEAHSFKSYRDDPYATGNPLPDSCYGDNLSAWRNVIDDCLTYSGTLYAEKAYTAYPIDVQARIHEWCFDEDGICDGTKDTWGQGHTKYATYEGVPRAVSEALLASGISPKAALIDLTNSSKRYDILFEVPMSCTPLFRFPAPIPSLVIPYAMNSVAGSNKQINIIGEYFSDMDYGPYEYSTKQYIASLWREGSEHIRYRISPFNCEDQYVGQGIAAEQYNIQSSSTLASSRNMLSTQDVADPIGDFNNATIISEIPGDPICQVSPTCYSVDSTTSVMTTSAPIYPAIRSITNTINSAVTYRLQQSPALSLYTTFAWDVNNDGQPDFITDVPFLRYAYSSPYQGPLKVTASSPASGLVASTEFSVNILENFIVPSIPLGPLDLSIDKLSNSKVTVAWKHDPRDTATARWLVRVDGYPIGAMALNATEVTITDMHLDNNNPRVISVSGLNSSNQEGESASITLQSDVQGNSNISPEKDQYANNPTSPLSHSDQADFILAAADQEQPRYLFSPTHNPTKHILPASSTATNTPSRQSNIDTIIAASLLAAGLALLTWYLHRRK